MDTTTAKAMAMTMVGQLIDRIERNACEVQELNQRRMVQDQEIHRLKRQLEIAGEHVKTLLSVFGGPLQRAAKADAEKGREGATKLLERSKKIVAAYDESQKDVPF